MADKGNDKFVYDITLNEQKNQQTPREATTKVALNDEVSTDNTNISQSENGVNSHSMQNDKKHTKFMLPTMESDDSDIQLYRNQQYVSENKALKKQVEILKKRVELLEKEFTLTKNTKRTEELNGYLFINGIYVKIHLQPG